MRPTGGGRHTDFQDTGASSSSRAVRPTDGGRHAEVQDACPSSSRAIKSTGGGRRAVAQDAGASSSSRAATPPMRRASARRADEPGAAPRYKTELNTYCQRVVRRPLSKADIMYTMVSFGPYHQAIVKLQCLDGISVAGELADNHWEAVHSAAKEALKFHASVHGPSVLEKRPKPKLGSHPEETPATEDLPAANPSLVPKVALNTMCARLARRYLVKGDTVYTTSEVDGGFQAQLKLNALPGRWQHMRWTGNVCHTRREAEQNCAEKALACLTSSQDIADLLRRRA